MRRPIRWDFDMRHQQVPGTSNRKLAFVHDTSPTTHQIEHTGLRAEGGKKQNTTLSLRYISKSGYLVFRISIYRYIENIYICGTSIYYHNFSCVFDK